MAADVAVLASAFAKAVLAWFENSPILTLTETNPSSILLIWSPPNFFFIKELKLLVKEDLNPDMKAPPSLI